MYCKGNGKNQANKYLKLHFTKTYIELFKGYTDYKLKSSQIAK